jgi:hypothetical protein
VLDGCLYCFQQEELDRLSGPVLDSISDEVICRFAGKNPEHWSPDQHSELWRRFIPRIIRLLLGPQMSEARRLLASLHPEHGYLQGWSGVEREAVFDALRTVWIVAVADCPKPFDVVALLEGLAQVTGDPTPWLHHLDQATDAGMETGFVRFVAFAATELHPDKDSFWDLQWSWGDDSSDLLRDWLCSAPVAARIQQFLATRPTDTSAKTAGTALQILRQATRQAGTTDGPRDPM